MNRIVQVIDGDDISIPCKPNNNHIINPENIITLTLILDPTQFVTLTITVTLIAVQLDLQHELYLGLRLEENKIQIFKLRLRLRLF